jgi:dienelactone hydrolase
LSPWGDDPSHGNGPHASIRPDELESSNWEEHGERVWDAMRALDYLISLPFVDSKNVIVTGLSMGGKIATIVGALDTRVSVVVASGWSPDTGVFCNTGHK